MEQRLDYTNVLFQDAQDPWEDFQSLLHIENPHYTVTNLDSHAPSTSQQLFEADEEKYQQVEAYLGQRQIRRHKRQYEKETGDVSSSRYPSTPWLPTYARIFAFTKFALIIRQGPCLV